VASEKKAGKGRKKIIAAAVCLALVVGGLAYGQNVARKRARAAATENLVQMKVSRGTVSKTVLGTGTLAADDAKDVKIPVGVKVDKVYVEAGDRVSRGDKIARVTETSVKEQILKIDEAIESKKDEIKKLDSSDDNYKLKKEVAETELDDLKDALSSMEKLKNDNIITAGAGGIVSQVNIAEGDTVSAGTGSSSGTQTGGTDIDTDKLKAYLNMSSAGESGTDKAYAAAEPAAYINTLGVYGSSMETAAAAEAETAAAAGTAAETVKASETETAAQESSALKKSAAESAGSGSTSGSGTSGSSTSASAPEAVNFSSINLSLTAPKAGAAPQKDISAADDLHLISALTWLPQTDKFASNQVYAAVITLKAKPGYYLAGKSGKINVTVDSCPDAVSASYDTDNDGYIDTATVVCPYFLTSENMNSSQLDYFSKASQKLAMQLLSKLSDSYPALQKEINKQIAKLEKQLAKAASSLTDSLTGSLSGSGLSSLLGGSSDLSSLLGSSSSDLSSLTGSSSSAYDQEYAVAASIVPVKYAYLDINVDELDINLLRTGQKAAVTMDAIDGQSFTASITRVAELANSDTGKFPVRLKMKKTDDMKFGMSATAEVKIEEKDNVLVIPLDAVQTLDGQDVVYASADADGNLSDPIKVKTGLSDGDNAEIVSGLEEGQTIYYFKSKTNYSVFNNMESETAD